MRNKIYFSGTVWIGVKEVDWIAKTSRRWKPMFSCQIEGKMDLIIQRLELEANQPPRTGWS